MRGGRRGAGGAGTRGGAAVFLSESDIVLYYLSCHFVYRESTCCMKGASIRNQMPYLDISQILLKQHSPYFRPRVPDHPHQAVSAGSLTPDLSPVLDGLAAFTKTPLSQANRDIGRSVLEPVDFCDLNDFSLEGDDEAIKNESKTKKIKKNTLRPRLHSTWHLADCDLDQIIEERDLLEDWHDSSSASSHGSDSSDEDNIIQSEDSLSIEEKQFEEERQSTTHFELLIQQEPLYLQWHNPNPKKELIARIKAVTSNDDLRTEQDKMEQIKSTIGNYIFDYERYYFEESMSQLGGSISNVLATLIRGIDHTFRRTIGGLSFERRRMKLVKYMEKKKRRVWRKKVNYDCRKKVADGRLRIKGKFVTYEQAREQLGMSSLEGYNADEIRNMLQLRADS